MSYKTAAAIAVLLVGAADLAHSDDKKGKKPAMELRSSPRFAFSPAQILFTAELKGGDDVEELYCPEVEWEWGDETSSESTTDCEPYEAGKSQIKRRYTVQHEFRRPGTYKIYLHFKSSNRILGSGTTTLQVQPGVGSGPDGL